MENNNKFIFSQDALESVVLSQVQAYEKCEQFYYDWGGNEEKPTVEDITDFIYRIYPTFFLQGICYKSKYYIFNNMEIVEIAPSLIKHCPMRYTRMRMSMFIRKLAEGSAWKLTDREIANIVLVCSADFSEDYMDFFPYTIRIFSGNEDKRRAYRTAFDGRPVEFSVIQFVEPQADEEEVVRSKLSDVEETEPDTNEMSVVDDTGVSLYAFGGSPGAAVKSFMDGFTPNRLGALLDALGEKRAHMNIAVGATYIQEGNRQRILVKARFPVDWGVSVYERDQKTFDDCVMYRGENLHDAHEPPQQILLEWLWHRFRRRLSHKI